MVAGSLSIFADLCGCVWILTQMIHGRGFLACGPFRGLFGLYFMAEEGYLEFSVTAGVLRRREIRRAIRSYCFEADLRCEIEEEKGFLSSILYIRIYGAEDVMKHVQDDLEDWFRRTRR